MTRLIANRVAGLIPVLFIVSIVSFAVLHLVPGSPADTILGPEPTAGQIVALNRQLGLDQPLLVQYFTWLGHAVRGDFGNSVISQQSVVSIIASCLPVTLSLAIGGLALGIVEGVGLGILMAMRPNSRLSRFGDLFTAVGLSIPGFWLAILLVIPFALWTHLFPATGYVPFTQSLFGWLRSIALGAFSLSLGPAASFTRQTRAQLERTMQLPFVRAARARGLSARRALLTHGLKNASIPVVTIVGYHTADLIGGAVFVEGIFGLNGIGLLSITSVQEHDYPVLQGIVVLTTLVVVAVNLVMDIVYGRLDPRVRAS